MKHHSHMSRTDRIYVKLYVGILISGPGLKTDEMKNFSKSKILADLKLLKLYIDAFQLQ